eukprot:TRINITY_DN8249_c0_g1_i2.p1 TRINITY_DN8249_c0_g1~~TRINITY_DN8249_c0_g1_i2.p1  ORF type:complete len:230 (+),score=18.16 TRINITY_DN8249_c0_g1_i2:112-801(+)
MGICHLLCCLVWMVGCEENTGTLPRHAARKATNHPRRSFKFSGPVPGGFRPAELKTLLWYYKRARSVFEWGMGSTTIFAAQMRVPRLTAVDSDFHFVAWMRARSNVSAQHRLVHSDIGPTGPWGYPLRIQSRPLFPFYSLSAISAEEPFDVYLIDGRFRIACACIALLHGRNDSIVLVHDFMDRYAYHRILSVADSRPLGGSLALLKRKPNVNAAAIKGLWELTKFDPY